MSTEDAQTADFEAAKGPYHDLRLHVANLCGRIHLANERWWRDLSTGEPVKRNVGELLMLSSPPSPRRPRSRRWCGRGGLPKGFCGGWTRCGI